MTWVVWEVYNLDYPVNLCNIRMYTEYMVYVGLVKLEIQSVFESSGWLILSMQSQALISDWTGRLYSCCRTATSGPS